MARSLCRRTTHLAIELFSDVRDDGRRLRRRLINELASRLGFPFYPDVHTSEVRHAGCVTGLAKCALVVPTLSK